MQDNVSKGNLNKIEHPVYVQGFVGCTCFLRFLISCEAFGRTFVYNDPQTGYLARIRNALHFLDDYRPSTAVIK